MKCYPACIALLLSALIVSACERNADEIDIVRSPSPAIVHTETVARVTPAPSDAQPSFRKMLKSLSFGQSNQETGQVFADWNAPDFPLDPVQFVYHLDNVSVHATLSGLSEKERQNLIDSIRVEGRTEWTIQPAPNHPNVISIDFSHPSEPFILNLGDLPPITFIRNEPVRFDVMHTSGPHLLLRAREYSTQLLLPEEEPSVVLVFSEDMQEKLPFSYDNAPIEAGWIDSRHLQIQLSKELDLRFDGLRSRSGNRLGATEGNLKIRQIPSYEWRDAITGGRAGWSARDRFYDQMVFSPDQKSYVGVVTLGGPMGDGDGTSYSFILEREGEPPLVMEDVFYSTIEPDDSPIHWRDAGTLLYSSYFGVYAYDIESGKKRTLYRTEPNERNNVNYSVYDNFRNRLYMLVFTARDESNRLELQTYEHGTDTPGAYEPFTETVLSGKYSYLDMFIHPTPKGIYFTRTQEGIPVTEFAADSGERTSVAGIVRLATEEGAFIQQYKKGEFQIEPQSWVFWQPSKPAKPMADPPAHWSVFVSGSQLISKHESAYYRYDPALNKWVLWAAANNEANAEPARGPNGLYRVNLPLEK